MSSIPCSRARSISLAGRRPELSLHLAAEAAQRGGGQHRLPRAADPDREVVVRAADRRRDRRGHVAVLDQLDARAGVADLLDQVVVPRPVEDDRRHVADPAAERLRDRLDVLGDGAPEVDLAARRRPDGHLAHVHVRQSRERARGAGRDHRHRAASAARDDARRLRADRARGRSARRRLRSAAPAREALGAFGRRRSRCGRRSEAARAPRASPRTRLPAQPPRRRARASARSRGPSARSRARSSRRGTAGAWPAPARARLRRRLAIRPFVAGRPRSARAPSRRTSLPLGPCSRSRARPLSPPARRCSPGGSGCRDRRSRYLSSARAPSEAMSRIQKWLACASSLSIASTHWTTSASAIGAGIPGTRCTPSSTVDQPSASERSIAALTPTSTFRVWSRKPWRSGSTSSSSALRSDRPGLEARVVDRRHELRAEERAQGLADEVGRCDARDRRAGRRPRWRPSTCRCRSRRR